MHLILNNIPADSEEWRNLLRAHLRPVPHLAEGRFLAQQPAVNAAIDISDGLSSDLGHIAEQSGVGAILDSNQIPVSGDLKTFCEQFNFDPVKYALAGGEDYTLLCTISPNDAAAIAQNFQKKFNRPLFRIGEITAGTEMKIDYPDGSSSPIAPSGWNHFKDEGG